MHRIFFVLIVAGFTAVIMTYALLSASRFSLPRHARDSALPATNSTLGFQAIFAVSRGTPWRVNGLMLAAAYNGLEITILPQPPTSTETVDAFRNAGAPGGLRPHRGAAAAWVAHLDVVKYIFQSGIDSALIIEDDADWDVSIKTQASLIASNIRLFTGTPATTSSPYGEAWDVLWLGHCGNNYKRGARRLMWQDHTSVPRSRYRAAWEHVLDDVPDAHRAVFDTAAGICTFGYAVSKKGAELVLRNLSHVRDVAYDNALGDSCGRGELKCLSIVPGVFSHYIPTVDQGTSSEVEAARDGVAALDPKLNTVVGLTANILNSSRCHVLFGVTCLT